MKLLLLLCLFQGEIDTRSLISDMTDLDRLTKPADYTNKQFSSYDRRSRTETKDKPKEWFANNDRGHYVRKDDDGFVLAEAEGPGAIVRIWSANPSGTIKIFLDGKEVLSEDFEHLVHGRIPAFGQFAGKRARGGNLYFPFPYAKSMKVVCNLGDQYYHVNYRTYPKGTKIKTFQPGKIYDWPRRAFPSWKHTDQKTLKGPGIVQSLSVKLPKSEKELRDKTIQIFIDDELCVWAPLGDFFGSSPGYNYFETIPMGMGTCKFPMPFEKSFRVEVDAPVTIFFEPNQSRPFRFYAWWRGKPEIPTRPMHDWNVMNVTGRGRMVGCSMTIGNPLVVWWGEGDEKIYVDGEDFPSTFGTGTEDYFGYAWCCPDTFNAPFHSQSRVDGPGNFGYTSNNRFHLIDDIPFQKSMKFDMEIWHWKKCTVSYSTMAYWYAEPGCQHDFQKASSEDRRIVTFPRPEGVEGAIEGESLEVIGQTTGNAHIGDLSYVKGFSSSAMVWWGHVEKNSTLQLGFQSPDKDKRTFAVCLVKAPNYGTVQLFLNEQPLGGPIDLHHSKIAPTGELKFEVDLKNGRNILKVQMVGANEAVKPKLLMFGLDYVRIP